MRARWCAAVLAGMLCSGSCAPSLLRLPDGPGEAAPDGPDVLAEATAACNAVWSVTAQVGVTGSVGGRRLRGRLLAGLAAPDAVHLDATAPFGESLFVFGARGGQATLLLPRDDRVLERGDPAAVLEAVTGVALDATALRLAMTGCPAAPRSDRARVLGPDWRLIPDDAGATYFRRDGRDGRWRMVAALHRMAGQEDWRADYRDFSGGLPRSIRFASLPSGRFDLRLSLSQVELNVPIPDEAFDLKIPSGIAPISLEELRQAGPLAAPDGR